VFPITGDYQTLLSLVTHKERVLSQISERDHYSMVKPALMLTIRFYFFRQAAGFLACQFGSHIAHGPLSPVELFAHHLLQTRFNSHAVATSLADQPVRSEEHRGNNVEMQRENKVGVAVYLTLSLINHSCKPNAILRSVYNPH